MMNNQVCWARCTQVDIIFTSMPGTNITSLVQNNIVQHIITTCFYMNESKGNSGFYRMWWVKSLNAGIEPEDVIDCTQCCLHWYAKIFAIVYRLDCGEGFQTLQLTSLQVCRWCSCQWQWKGTMHEARSGKGFGVDLGCAVSGVICKAGDPACMDCWCRTWRLHCAVLLIQQLVGL